MDRGQKETEKILRRATLRINREYSVAVEEITDGLNSYLKRFEKKDETWRKWVANGERTKEEYTKWRIGQMAVGKRWNDQKDAIAHRLYAANQKAKEIIRSYAPEVYAENFNFATYQVEKDAKIVTAFTLYSKESVERLVKDDPDILPPIGKKTAQKIAEGKAIKWNRQQVQSVMIQGIMQGDSIPKLATRLATTVADRDRKASIRNARTLATGTQNAGRVAAYKRAEEKGVDLDQMWMAVLDGRTRHSHRWLDGEIRPVGEQFSNGLEYPADPHGDASEIYNCRCSLRGVVKGLERRAVQYRDDKIEGMTYDEWRNAKATSKKITAPDEKTKSAKQGYVNEYKNGIIDTDTRRERDPFKDAHSRFAELSPEEFERANRLWKELPEISMDKEEKAMVFSNFNENLSNEQRSRALVSMPIRDYRYYAVNKGFNDYKVYGKEAIDITYDNVVDEVLSEMYGRDWKKDLDEWYKINGSNKSL